MIFRQSEPPIYLFCADFFTYIGGRLCSIFRVGDSLFKLGADFEILSELGHNPGARVITFSLNVQTFLCFSGTMVPRGLHVQRTTCTVSDHSCSCERPDGPLHVQTLTVQKARCTVRARRHFRQRWLQHGPWGNATKG